MPKNEGRELVEFSRRGLEWFCRPGGGLQQAIRKLKTPSSQRPRIVLLIGANTQRAAKEAIFKVRRSNGRGPTQVDVVESTRNTEEPLLIVTLDIEESYKLFRSSNPLSTSKTSRVVWNDDCKPSTQFWLIVTLLRQALLPFVDVACIFLDDFANHEEGTRLLNEWQEHPISSPPCAAQIIVISTRHSQACSTTHVRHLHVQSNRARDSQLHRKLASTIHESLCISRNHRDRYRISFSAIHLESLFEAALHQAKTSRSARFDYIVATRRFNKVEEDFVRHLEGFFGLCAHVGLVGSVVTTYVASALLLDSSPPGTHSKYREVCPTVFKDSQTTRILASRYI